MVFFPLPLTRLSVFLCCSIQLPQQSCFLLHTTPIEYTRLYSSITEVLIYTVEPRIPCYDVFLSVGLLNRTLSAHEFCQNCIYHPVQSSPFIVRYAQIIHFDHSKHVIIITIHALLKPACFLHRSIFSQHYHHCLKQYLDVHRDIPVLDVFLVQSHHFFEVCDIASATDLPQSGDARFDGQSCIMM